MEYTSLHSLRQEGKCTYRHLFASCRRPFLHPLASKKSVSMQPRFCPAVVPNMHVVFIVSRLVTGILFVWFHTCMIELNHVDRSTYGVSLVQWNIAWASGSFCVPRPVETNWSHIILTDTYLETNNHGWSWVILVHHCHWRKYIKYLLVSQVNSFVCAAQEAEAASLFWNMPHSAFWLPWGVVLPNVSSLKLKQKNWSTSEADLWQAGMGFRSVCCGSLGWFNL